MNKIFLGLLIIYAFLYAGSLISSLLVPVLPGNVIGMMLLFVALQLRLVRESWVESVANFMVANILIFFIPAAVGIMVILPAVADEALKICLVVILSTTAVLFTVGKSQQYFSRGRKDKVD